MQRVFAIAAFVLLASPVAHSDMEETRATAETLRVHVLKLINRDRQIYRLPPVELDSQVSSLGDTYCRTQIRNGTTGHYTIDGLAPYMRYSFGGGNDAVSENAAAWSANYSFSDRALFEMARRSQDAMMAEMPPNDGHRRTILDPHATHVGIGMAWEGGEFRLVQEFVRRYVNWTRALPRRARLGDTVLISGSPIGDVQIEAITVHYEQVPVGLTVAAANAIERYALPSSRKDYLPRLKNEYRRNGDGTLAYVKREYSDGRRGDFYLGDAGDFSFTIPLTQGTGVYTIVVWVRRPGFSKAVSATTVSMRVEESLQNVERTSAAGR